MAPKKEKAATVTVDESEAKIMAYMKNLHGAISRPAVNRALAALETRGQLDSKTFGKQIVYVATQSTGDNTESDTQEGGSAAEKTVEEVETELEELKAEDETLSKAITKMKTELADLLKSSTNVELQETIVRLSEQTAKLAERLERLTATANSAGANNTTSAPSARAMRGDLAKMLHEWERRRRMFYRVWTVIRENVPNAQELWDDLGLEEDCENIDDVIHPLMALG